MKYYIQFKTLSTGYIQGTIPPQFSKENIKPIDKIGSDGIYYLDNRLSLSNMIGKGFELCKQKNNTVGFSLVRYNGTILNGKEVKTIIF